MGFYFPLISNLHNNLNFRNSSNSSRVVYHKLPASTYTKMIQLLLVRRLFLQAIYRLLLHTTLRLLLQKQWIKKSEMCPICGQSDTIWCQPDIPDLYRGKYFYKVNTGWIELCRHFDVCIYALFKELIRPPSQSVQRKWMILDLPNLE